jgi:hypothetical protein
MTLSRNVNQLSPGRNATTAGAFHLRLAHRLHRLAPVTAGSAFPLRSFTQRGSDWGGFGRAFICLAFQAQRRIRAPNLSRPSQWKGVLNSYGYSKYLRRTNGATNAFGEMH